MAAVILVGASGTSGTSAATTAALEGTRQITLHAQGGAKVVIGQVRLTPGPQETSRFELTMNHAAFTDHFLSMREFKCLGGGTEILCHVPYPYPHPATVTDADPAWLEHALLFMFKKPGEFGAKLWNGVYWKLTRTERGWVGSPQAVDLNQIGAPPDKPGPPFRPALRSDMPAGARWFERLTVE